jgi:predicted nuclease with TOPRIM domain
MTAETEKAVDKLEAGLKTIKEVMYKNINETRTTLAEMCTNIAILIQTCKGIEEQTKKTNGKVIELEKKVNDLELKHASCAISSIASKIDKLEKTSKDIDDILIVEKFKQKFPDEAKKLTIGNMVVISIILLGALATLFTLVEKFF